MSTAGPGLIPDPFLARHRVAGALLALLALVVLGAVTGALIGSLLAQAVDLVLGVVGGSG
ncbi:hypothetical protein [Nocardioides sp.]|uniref:hypothetical protein n=1 Tax=Nocardioides sp. TaxID=35761 RepID=UPI003783943B